MGGGRLQMIHHVEVGIRTGPDHAAIADAEQLRRCPSDLFCF
jgi:hypothetical protein